MARGLNGAGEGNRTLVVSLEGFCSTIELHPQHQTLECLLAGPFYTAFYGLRLDPADYCHQAALAVNLGSPNFRRGGSDALVEGVVA